MRRQAFWLAMLFLLTVLLGGCGAGGSSKVEDSKAAAPNQAAPSESQSAPAEAPKPPTADSEQKAASVSAVNIDRKIIQNAQLDVKVKDADAAITQISQAVRAAGGYLPENRVEGTKERGRRVTISLRVSAGSFGSIITLVEGLGEVNNRREWSSDVTEEYLDLDARIKAKESHLAQLRKLQGQAGSIKELMELEQEIARVTGETESLKGRFQFLSNQVAFSTVQVNLYEPGVPTPIKNPQTLWERMSHGFISSWNGVVNFLGDLLVFVVAKLPVLLFLAVLGLIGYGVARRAKGWRSRRSGPPPQE